MLSVTYLSVTFAPIQNVSIVPLKLTLIFLSLSLKYKINGKKVPAEAYLLQKAQHRNVIKLYDVFATKDYYVYVMERPRICEDLSRVLKKRTLTENEARRYFFQILEANINCEENGVLHRDLKPANILVDMDTDEIKLIDFGLASKVQYEPYNLFRGRS